jgi:hypothetical protein
MMTILFINDSYSILTVIGVAVVSFAVGLLSKMALIRKQRKRILNLEDEMLTNHARILNLEKKITESRKDTNAVQHDFDISSSKPDREAKIS